MSNRVTVGIDNGSTGSVGIIGPNGAIFEKVPTQPYLHYGKKGSIGQRLDRAALINLILGQIDKPTEIANVRAYIERPFSGRFINSVVPAHRFFEATIIVMEDLKIGYEVVDSREWQPPILGNVKTSAKLKLASELRGVQLYPQLRDAIKSHGEADGLLIAHFFHHNVNRIQQS